MLRLLFLVTYLTVSRHYW